MKLSSEQRKKLQEALIDAFPDKSSLEQMLSFGLNKNLDSIAGGSNLQNIVFNLIVKAEAENWIEELINAAHRQNPGNEPLKEFALKKVAQKEKFSQNQIGRIPKLSDIPTTGFNASEVGANYTRLANYLKAKNFLAADIETARIMLWVARREEEDWLRKKDIEKFPCRDLRTINQLWLVSSGGKFGFSVQNQIWINCGGKDYKYDKHETIIQSCEKFLECVQWKVGGEWVWELSHEEHWWEDRILQWTWENVLNEQWRRGIEWSWYQMGLPFAGNLWYLTWNLRAVRGHLPITIHNLVGWSGLKIVDEGSYDPTTKDPKTEDSTTSPRTGRSIMILHVPEDHYCHFLSDGFLSHAATCKL